MLQGHTRKPGFVKNTDRILKFRTFTCKMIIQHCKVLIVWTRCPENEVSVDPPCWGHGVDCSVDYFLGTRP